MIRINQIKLPVEASETELKSKIASIIKTSNYSLEKIAKKSLDARDKNKLMYIYAVDINSDEEELILKRNKNNNNIMLTKTDNYIIKDNAIPQINSRPVIIGAGPAGYFCGLYLARMGFKPLIFERGKSVEERSRDVEGFWDGEKINPESNVSFGEGGAGTFSDGKLNTGIKDREGRIQAVVKDFIDFGAPEDIGYLSKPHIGTDELKKVLSGMRQEIIALGGEIHFQSKLTDIECANTKTETDTNITITINDSYNNKTYTVCTDALVLAIGHSARDTFTMLNARKVPMEPKSFAIGLRIEHKRKMIDESQYGTSKAASKLPAADYKMTYRSSKGRSVYSFCMCPGGFVVNASSGENQAVVNGMSNHARDEVNSNSAIVVNVTPDDFANEGFGSYGVLSGVEFQKKYEQLTYEEGHGAIPVQRFGDYKTGIASVKTGNIQPNIKGKYQFGNLNNCLPAYVNNAIIEGIDFYNTKLKGFGSDNAMLSGIESRTSSPVRIIRNEELMSEFKGLFPCGEGAGYAGGITSAAVDGIKTAEAIAIYLNKKFS